MKFAGAIAIASFVPGFLALTINTPSSLVQCEPSLISWSDGTAPYYLSVIPGGEPSATALKSFDSTNATSLTWTVDIASETSVTLAIKDSTGSEAYTDALTIQSSSDSSCVSSSTAASASAGTAAATSISTATGTTGSTGTSTKTSAATNVVSASSTNESASSSNSASRSNIVGYGVAGLFGLAAALL